MTILTKSVYPARSGFKIFRTEPGFTPPVTTICPAPEFRRLVRGHIDAMIVADPKVSTATTTVAYYTLRSYVVSRRAAQETPGTS